MDAILSATIIPAKFFNMEDRLGTIEPGKLADMALLTENPPHDISNIRKIDAVVFNGRLLDRSQLIKSPAEVEGQIAQSLDSRRDEVKNKLKKNNRASYAY